MPVIIVVMGDGFDRTYYEQQRPSSGFAKLVDDARDRFIQKQILKRVGNGRLLDVGCGVGEFLFLMSGDFDVFGIEISDEGLRRASERIPSGTFASGDVMVELPFEGIFDVVTMVNVLEHLCDPEAALRNVASVQEPGGLLIVHLPTIGNRFQRRLYMGSYSSDPTHVFRPSGPAVITMLKSVGYETVTFAYAPFFPSALMSRLPVHPAFLVVASKR